MFTFSHSVTNQDKNLEKIQELSTKEDAKSQFELGKIYQKEKDYKKAFEYFQESANQGYSKAEHRLEICYRGQDIDAGCYVSYLDDSGLEGYDFSRLRLKRDL